MPEALVQGHVLVVVVVLVVLLGADLLGCAQLPADGEVRLELELVGTERLDGLGAAEAGHFDLELVGVRRVLRPVAVRFVDAVMRRELRESVASRWVVGQSDHRPVSPCEADAPVDLGRQVD